MDSVKLVLDLNTTEHGYAIRSIRVDLLESCPGFSLLSFVQLGQFQAGHGTCPYLIGAFLEWRYPNSWMVYDGNSQ